MAARSVQGTAKQFHPYENCPPCSPTQTRLRAPQTHPFLYASESQFPPSVPSARSVPSPLPASAALFERRTQC